MGRWNLDNVSSIDHALRPAPSFNHGKPRAAYDPPRNVVVDKVRSSECRLNPSEIEEWLDLQELGSPDLVPAPDDAGDSERPLSETERCRLTEALECIPSDDRDVWLRVGMALHRCGEAAIGRELWDEWSSKSGKFDEKDQQRTWDSFARQEGATITLGTLFHLAKENGWRPPPPQAQSRPVEFSPFPTECLPDPLASFTREAARAMGCDESSIGPALLVMLAAVIGNKRRIRLKRTWSEPAALWMAILGESGSMKSPALDAVVSPLRRIQAASLKEFDEAQEEFQATQLKFEKDLAAWKKSGKGEPPEAPTKPVPRRCLCSDTTVEALAPILRDNSGGVLLFRDELSGWIRSFDAYKSGKGGDEEKWLEAHRAGSWLVDRKGGAGPIHVPRAHVSVLGGTQPETLKSVLRSDKFESGLAARILFVMPPRLAKVWSEEDLSIEVEAGLVALVAELMKLEFDTDSEGSEIPGEYRFSDSGKRAWVKFYNEHAKELNEQTGKRAAAWSKLEGYAARLALILHCTRVAAGEITGEAVGQIDEQSVKAAVELTRWFANETERVYQRFEETDGAKESRELVQIIRRKGGRITARSLMRRCRKYRGRVEDAKKALDKLVAQELGMWEKVPPSKNGGRPTEVFVLHEHGDDEHRGVGGEGGNHSTQRTGANDSSIDEVVSPSPPDAHLNDSVEGGSNGTSGAEVQRLANKLLANQSGHGSVLGGDGDKTCPPEIERDRSTAVRKEVAQFEEDMPEGGQ